MLLNLGRENAERKTMNDKASNEQESKNKEKVTFLYERSPQYRSIYVTGAFGGITSEGAINIHFYHGTNQVPTKIHFDVSPEGVISNDDSDREYTGGKVNEIREVDFSAAMTPSTARNIASWLVAYAGQADEVRERVSELQRSRKEANGDERGSSSNTE